MRRTRVAGITGAIVMIFGSLATGAIPAAAESASTQPVTGSGATPAAGDGIVDAVQEDLGTTAERATEILADQAEAGVLRSALDDALGPDFGGAYYDESTGELFAGVTDPARLDTVRGLGAEGVLVEYSADQLDAAVDKLNRHERRAPESVTGWGVAPTTNSVTVTVRDGATDEARSYVREAGVDAGKVRYEHTADEPRLLSNLRGGDSYNMSRSRCSIGFSVQGGFLSAGHCPALGGTSLSKNGRYLGTATSYRFPGADWALARVTSSWTPTPQVAGLGTVRGAQEAPVGARACKSGSTSGVTCGVIQAKNRTVRYSQGAVYGLTQTTIHASPGDSGGSVMAAGGQAQGMVSGGSQSTMYFEPVRRALRATGARLVTG
ncbi:alpha-lytic protease prodomain-containing protein [Haloechinothrix sp. YIM 98757]|uniref:Alpha-lytic protease prodomain-containing protein n=1 Tax=Haloechinothrix aidingensis TaxID=2752311 RepID=A0A838AAB8_9PSEU|nr:S1 family peptidase [Haloechinothrix aidingensis]MBA0126101.1 alpha-lytic protease prodomain-containing protein [Haloechinothrix aidingensis]